MNPQDIRTLLTLCQGGLNVETLAAITNWSIDEAQEMLDDLCHMRVLKRMCGGTYEFQAATETCEEILQVMRRSATASAAMLCTTLDMPATVALEHLRWLEAHGFLRYQAGRWALCPSPV